MAGKFKDCNYYEAKALKSFEIGALIFAIGFIGFSSYTDRQKKIEHPTFYNEYLDAERSTMRLDGELRKRSSEIKLRYTPEHISKRLDDINSSYRRGSAGINELIEKIDNDIVKMEDNEELRKYIRGNFLRNELPGYGVLSLGVLGLIGGVVSAGRNLYKACRVRALLEGIYIRHAEQGR